MEPVLRWLLTYLLHSTVLLGLAALARLALRERRLALQEALLRAALVGGFATAGLQVGLDLHPLGGRLAIPATLAVPGSGSASAAPAGVAVTGPRPTIAVADAPVRDGDGGLAVDAPSARLESTAPVAILPAWLAGAADEAGDRLPRALALAWAALAAVALARLGVAAVRLNRLLRGRRPIDAGVLGPLAARIGRALGLRRRVPLSAAERLSVPLATGVLRPEVCLPERAVAELGTDEQAALCAHELAHVARRDPAWVLLARLVEALAPAQPLNGWARRRLQDLAECLSDDLAVAASGRPLGLARSLVDVASWTLGDLSILSGAAVGAVSARSRLGHRVERLMDPARRLERPRRLLLPAAAACVLATALVTPVVSGSVTAEEPQPAAAPRPPAEARVALEPRPAPPAPAAEPAPVPEPPDAAPAPAPEPPAAPKARPAPAPKAAPAPAPKAPPAPAPEAPPAPAPMAAPAPKAHPAPAPRAAPAPAAPMVEVPSAEAAERLEKLSRHIAERARLHEGEMQKLQAEIDAIASRIQPDTAEMARLGAEIAKVAQELAESAGADLAGEGARAGKRSEQTAEAARRMAELQKQLRDTARAIRVPEAELRALAEKARAFAEQARPTPDELAEIRRLSHDQARLAAELARHQAQLTSEQVREAMRAAREALEHARDAMRRSLDEQREHGRDREGDRPSDEPREPNRD